MPTIALLRAVNVGGIQLKMADLRAALAALGFADAQTLLQSGNVVFEAGQRGGAELARLLEEEIKARLGIATDAILRSPKEWREAIAANPFAAAAKRDPSRLLIMFMKSAPDRDDVAALRAKIAGPEQIAACGRELYLVYPAGIARSRLTNALIEKTLRVRGTARNWNTVEKLAVLAGA